ncbi:hypothetical protein PybrP1_013044 [[Pythium] brassicae (nom. inval.)]|nr:hypothetical protein PybrP1_013044 [[Pythium] brassicae (nom. inval.)]
MSGLTAVDVVIREREEIAALPGVVLMIRRFADTPVLAKLRRAVGANATALEIERLLLAHEEDARLDPGTRDEQAASVLTREQVALVQRVLVTGAKHGSEGIVRWCLGVAPRGVVAVNGALRAAVNGGQLGAVRLLHPQVTRFGLGFAEELLLDLAAARGHVHVLEWLHENRRGSAVRCSSAASEEAAKAGHVDSLQWIRAMYPEQWSSLVLDCAAVYGQRHVVEWLIEAQIPVCAARAMLAVAKKLDLDLLVWLHDKYQGERLPLWSLKTMASTSQRVLASQLVRRFPSRYAAYGVVIGVLSGDLELMRSLAASGRREKSEAKKAMCLAARLGRLDMVCWLSGASEGLVPTKALWDALRCGHVDVIRWVVAQKPELRTRERLREMRSTVRKQQPQPNSSSFGASELLSHWLDEQLCLIE